MAAHGIREGLAAIALTCVFAIPPASAAELAPCVAELAGGEPREGITVATVSGDLRVSFGDAGEVLLRATRIPEGVVHEIVSRAAEIYDRAGFDMIYFEGGEDVPGDYWYHSSKFQLAALERIRRRPVIHQGTILTHYLWHTFARTNTAVSGRRM